MYNVYIKDMMSRYVYDVVRRLPKNQREDIEKELYTLIEDMLNERAGDKGIENKDIEDVLAELGSPANMARQYRGNESHLIGGEYYDQYCYILKIVLVCAGVGLLISNIASFFIHSISEGGIFNGSFEGVWDIVMIPSILIQIFAWITIVFALTERFHVKLDLGFEVWEPNKLPLIPDKKALIKRGDSIASIVFGVLCIILFTFAPQLMGAWINANGKMYSIPIFNLEGWTAVLPLFLICIALGIVKNLVELINGRYNKQVAITTLITSAMGLIVTVIIFKVFDVWNPNFVSEIERIANLNLSGSFDILANWNTTWLTNMVLAVIALLYTIDSVVAVYRAVRY